MPVVNTDVPGKQVRALMLASPQFEGDGSMQTNEIGIAVSRNVPPQDLTVYLSRCDPIEDEMKIWAEASKYYLQNELAAAQERLKERRIPADPQTRLTTESQVSHEAEEDLYAGPLSNWASWLAKSSVEVGLPLYVLNTDDTNKVSHTHNLFYRGDDVWQGHEDDGGDGEPNPVAEISWVPNGNGEVHDDGKSQLGSDDDEDLFDMEDLQKSLDDSGSGMPSSPDTSRWSGQSQWSF